MHQQFGGFINDPTAQLGLSLGKNAVDAGQQYMEQNVRSPHTCLPNELIGPLCFEDQGRRKLTYVQFGRFVSASALKHYFNVTNRYVLAKLTIVLFPWRHSPWSRKPRDTSDPSSAASAALMYEPPRTDVNSPDMYIPTMALVTYILLSTLLAGLRGAFHPELLGYTATLAISVTLLEILIIRTGTFLLAISSSSQLLDLVAYSGYKFVHVIVSLLLTHLFSWLGFASSWVSWAVFLYCYNANSFFLLRSLKYVLLPEQRDPSMGGNAAMQYGQGKSQKSARRTYFLFAYSYVVQLGFMLWLSRV
jgi:hypothetical protein